jgi:hypothetical protein
MKYGRKKLYSTGPSEFVKVLLSYFDRFQTDIILFNVFQAEGCHQGQILLNLFFISR